MLEVKNLKKVYKSKKGNKVVALNGINLKFPEAGLIFILGKSGSGKSTLLNVISGLDAPDGGEIIIADKSSKNFTERDFDAYRNTYLGFIFQEYNILNEFSVKDNIALALELQNKPVEKSVIDNILKVVDLVEFSDRKPNELSGGQKQRVAIARALVKEPNVIFADEPTGNLDSKSSSQIFNFIKKLSKEKLVIVVTHDEESAVRYGDRIIELSDGLVISDKTVNNDYIDVASKNRKHYFDETKIIKVDRDVRFRPITANLPNKVSRKIALNNIANKKVRLIVTLILIVIALSLFGFAEILANYNLVDASLSSFERMDIENIRIEQGRIEEYIEFFSRSREVIEPETVEKVEAKFPNIQFNKYYPFINMPVGSKNGATFMPTNIRGVVITDKKGIEAMGYKLVGEFPEENTTDIVLTDFMIFNLIWSDLRRLGYGRYTDDGKDFNILSFLELLVENDVSAEDSALLLKVLTDIILGDYERDTSIFTRNESEEVLTRIVTILAKAGVDRPLIISGGNFHITGVIMTGFEKFLDIINKPIRDIISDPRILELQEKTNYYFGNFYAAEGFMEEFNKKQIALSTRLIPSQDTFSEWLIEMEGEIADYKEKNKGTYESEDDNPGGIDIFYFPGYERDELYLADNEIIISQAEFRNTYTVDYTIWKPNASSKLTCPIYTFTYAVSNLDWKSEPTEMKVVGVIKEKRIMGSIDNKEAVVKNFVSPYTLLVSENTYQKVAHDIQKIGALYFRLPKNATERRAIVAYLCDTSPEGDLLYHLSPISEIVYAMSDTLSIMQILFRYLSYILGGFSIILLTNFMTTSVMARQTEIGILRALGCRSRDVSKIFLFEAGVIGVVNIILTSIFMVLTTIGANALFRNAFIRFFKSELVNYLSLLTLSVAPFIWVSAISIVIMFFATIIPARKISKMKPVDAIKKA